MNVKIDVRAIEKELQKATRKAVVKEMSYDEIITEIRRNKKALKLIRIIDKKSTKSSQGMNCDELQPFIENWQQIDFNNALTILRKYNLIEILSPFQLKLTDHGNVIAVKLRHWNVPIWSGLSKIVKLIFGAIVLLGAVVTILVYLEVKLTDVVEYLKQLILS